MCSTYSPHFPDRHRPRHFELPDGDSGDAGRAAGHSDGPHALLRGGRGPGEGREGMEQIRLSSGTAAADLAALVWVCSAAGGG